MLIVLGLTIVVLLFLLRSRRHYRHMHIQGSNGAIASPGHGPVVPGAPGAQPGPSDRLEYLQPLVASQPYEPTKLTVNNINGYSEQPAAPKDAPLDDWHEFDDSWQEGSLDADTDA